MWDQLEEEILELQVISVDQKTQVKIQVTGEKEVWAEVNCAKIKDGGHLEAVHQFSSYQYKQWQKGKIILTGFFNNSVCLVWTLSPLLGRMSRQMVLRPRQERSNFSTRAFPTKPVAPVTRTQLPLKKFWIGLSETLASVLSPLPPASLLLLVPMLS